MLTIKITTSISVFQFEVPHAPDERIEYVQCDYKNCPELVRRFDSCLPHKPVKFCSHAHRVNYWRQRHPWY